MNSIRFKLGTHVLLVVSSILISTLAVAAGANWINPASEKPAYVILAQRNIQHTKIEKQEKLEEQSRDFTRVSD